MSVHGPALFSLVAIAIRAVAVRAAFAVIFSVVVAETAKRWLRHRPGSALAVGSAVAVRPTVAVAVSAARHDGKRVWTKKKKLEATSRERASERENK
jgi:sensor histidine kinase regulating citrate/malate metabolism